MAYEHERTEWRAAVRQLTEADRYINTREPRWARGLTGEPEDTVGGDND